MSQTDMSRTDMSRAGMSRTDMSRAATGGGARMSAPSVMTETAARMSAPSALSSAPSAMTGTGAGTTGAAAKSANAPDPGNRSPDKGRSPQSAPLESTEDIVAALEAAADAAREEPAGEPDGINPDSTSPNNGSPDSANPNNGNPNNANPDNANHGADGPPDPEAPQDSREAAEALEPDADPRPDSWDAETKALMQALPPDLQERFARREAGRLKAAQALQQEALHARANHDALLHWAGNNLDTAFAAARMAAEGDFAVIDWLSLQKNDPAEFLRLDALRKERVNALEQSLVHLQALREHETLQHRERHAQYLQHEFSTAAPAVQKLVGPSFESPAFRKEIVEYLNNAGAPAEHINGIDHGYQLVLATKAMLYDKMERARASAAKKVAQAPTVQTAKARPARSGSDAEARKWSEALDKDPYNKDALVQLLLSSN